MTFTTKFYPQSRFGGFTDIDGTIIFYNRVNSLLTESATVLDVGCGRGEYQDDECDYRRRLRILRGKCKKVIGIDVDVNAKDNPYIDEFHRIVGDIWTEIEDNSVDLLVCDYVLEHIEFPDRLFLGV
jgi:SAM-dependent methyltransferase